MFEPMQSPCRAALEHPQPSTSQASQPTLSLATTWDILGIYLATTWVQLGYNGSTPI